MNPSVYLFYFCRVVPAFALSLVITSAAAAETCLECHAVIRKDFNGSSHHVQGVTTTDRHCYSCHWEAAADGTVNERYHRQNPAVDLVVWTNGQRPAEHVSGKTAVSFTPAAMGTDRERSETAAISVHCLSCHNDASLQTTPFEGDANSPARYAWDRESIASRYAAKETTRWGKYSTASSNRKMRLTKAFSAHGNAAANEGGWTELIGYDGEMPLTRGGKDARNIECFDCHNSHGSSIGGITASYPAPDNSHNGGILKQTFPGRSGYKTAYQPSINSYSRSSNPFNAGAGLCFDCHETAAAGATPWGYRATFGAARPVMGYKDSAGFADGSKGSSGKAGGKQGKGVIASSHLKAGAPLEQPPARQINGLCTPCHDPHGVSRTLGSNMAYAVPLLKGSWLTSPYREDGPPDRIPARRRSGIDDDNSYNAANRDSGSNLTGNTDYNRVNRDAGANFAAGADHNRINRDAGANLARNTDFNRVNRDAASNLAADADYNRVNRDAGVNLARDTDFNRVNRDTSSNLTANADYNRVNRDAGANLAGNTDFNRVNRDTSSNLAANADYNRVNRDAGANLAGNTDFNRVNRDTASNLAADADYNRVNRDAGANLARDTDFNRVNRDTASNLAADADYNRVNRDAGANSTNRDAGANPGRNSSVPREPVRGMKYHLDRDTFGNGRSILENDASFAGLCLGCHKKETLTGTAATAAVHRTVKGWGSNREHAFPCSKCHQAHNSGLPRLMQTNCFDKGPAGLRDNGALFRSGPGAAESGRPGRQAATMAGCHVKQFGRSGSAPTGSNWQGASPW